MKIYHLFFAGLAIMLAANSSRAEIVLSEDFSGGSAATLNGTAEDASGVLWETEAGYGIDGSITAGRSPALLGFYAHGLKRADFVRSVRKCQPAS